MKLKQNANQRQKFVISPEVFKSVSQEEVLATWNDMCDLNLDRPPFHHFDIELDGCNVFSGSVVIPSGTKYDDFEELLTMAGKKVNVAKQGIFNVIMKYNFAENYTQFAVGVYAGDYKGNSAKFQVDIDSDVARVDTPKGTVETKASELQSFSAGIMKLLVVLLATKNIEKRTKVDKLAKLGIGKNKHNPHTVTYLHIGKVTENVDGTTGGATGYHIKAHLRRGHKRDQRYGLGLKYKKSIFIQPCFVNADKEWIADRTEYRLL